MVAVVIDDDPVMLQTIPDLLEVLHYSAVAFKNPFEGLKFIEREIPDVILCDLSMPKIGGLEVLQKCLELNPDLTFIVMTGFASVESAVKAMKLGAADYIQKPFTLDHLKLVLQRATTEKSLRQENKKLKAELNHTYSFNNIIGKSASMQKIFAQIEKVAPTNASVFIHGESGTGKELIAKAIHAYSLRKNNQFIGVDCVSIPNHLLESELFGYEKGAFTGANSQRIGLLEAAQGGTFFLDEVTEIDYDVQAKLLRMLQERQFRRVGGRDLINIDLRFLAATKRNPLQAVEDKIFREDLYYRLNVIPIELPPLRQRKEDIPLLIHTFIKSAMELTNGSEPTHLDGDALHALINYNWPGNIRELKNIIERLCIMASNNRITIDDVPTEILGGTKKAMIDKSMLADAKFKDAKEYWLSQFEKEYIENSLKKYNGNISKAAIESGVNRRTYHRLMEKYQIGNFRDFRG